VTLATNMAGRGVDIKLGGPEATPEEAEEIKSLGGLFVLGTERHEARRIDNQLRGRSGRQGDPGETQFFVSMDDSLMRVFGGERMKNLMGTFKIPEDQPIEMGMISKTLESAQTRLKAFTSIRVSRYWRTTMCSISSDRPSTVGDVSCWWAMKKKWLPSLKSYTQLFLRLKRPSRPSKRSSEKRLLWILPTVSTTDD
jgi:hypothetical protein